MHISSAVCLSAIKLNFLLTCHKTRTLTAIQAAQSRLESGDSAQNAAHDLIDESKDILAQALDAQVCYVVIFCF